MKGALQAQIRRVGRRVYWRLPPRWRDTLVAFVFARAGHLFRGYPAYELWRLHGEQRAAKSIGLAGRLTDLAAVEPRSAPPGRIAVHAHLYYADLAPEFAVQLRHMPFPYDLLVSVADEQGRRRCEQAFAGLPELAHLEIRVVPNRGRDIAPMLCAFREQLREYDLLAHVHSKKSLYNQGATDGWRSYLLASLFGSRSRLQRIFALLADRRAGMVFPQCYARVPYFASTWLANRGLGTAWARRLGIGRIPSSGYFDFPVGSMFWARVDALRPLFDAGITLEDFPPEQGQADGTLAHVVERLLGLVALDSGMPLAILPDTVRPSWSHWRFEQYLQRDRQITQAILNAPGLRLLVFDIFDTLLLRPLVDPERTKDIVARRAGGDLGRNYLAWRAQAEASARQRAGRDVGVEEIFTELARLAQLAPTDAARLRELEIAVESASVSLRPGALDLFRYALESGKIVALASDMFLPRETIESMLRRCGLTGWSAFFLSSEVGVRKDTGALYRHILETYVLPAEAVLMVGDNERSDLQVPADMGIRTLHQLRPVELARGMHRLRPLLERVEYVTEPDHHLALGLIVREGFGALFPGTIDAHSIVPQPTARALGYAAAGPLALAFVQWLIEQARQDGVARLYFLAREGEFLHRVYERVAATMAEAPPAKYLVVSRRAVNVPAIRGLDDVVEIARTDYGPAPLEGMLRERFGVELDPVLARDLDRRGIWKRGRLLEIREKDVDHLLPVLEAILPAIIAQGRLESAALEAYLDRAGLGNGREGAAVVDVGYSATIQRGLNRLLGGGLHGYYMATFESTASMEMECAARATGCFYHQVSPGPDSPPFIAKSFYLEKLLSADSAQLVCYQLDEAGQPQPRYRTLSEAELATRSTRAELRAGAMQLVEDALRLRAGLLPDFVYPPDIALALNESLIDDPSPAEAAVLGELVLDDHYCGRGVVA